MTQRIQHEIPFTTEYRRIFPLLGEYVEAGLRGRYLVENPIATSGAAGPTTIRSSRSGSAITEMEYRRGFLLYEMSGNAGGQQTDLFDEEDGTEAQELISTTVLSIIIW